MSAQTAQTARHARSDASAGVALAAQTTKTPGVDKPDAKTADILSIRHLSKSFGQSRVIKNISLRVPPGSVFGFLGENGAGKTTTMKMVLGLLKPDAGEIVICGERVRFGMTATNRHVGYLPDVPQFYSYMRPKEYLRLCGEVVGLPAELIQKRSAELLGLVGLEGVNKRIGSFSRGMKQRLGVAQALINEPRLLLCDEPTSALDPVGRKEILDILRQIRGKTTVVFSTHILSDVERICDTVAILHGGHIVLEGTLAELKARHQTDELHIEFASASDKVRFLESAPPELLAGVVAAPDGAAALAGAPALAAAPAALAAVAPPAAAATPTTAAPETELTLRVANLAAAELAILKLLATQAILPHRFEVIAPTIENLFLEAVQ